MDQELGTYRTLAGDVLLAEYATGQRHFFRRDLSNLNFEDVDLSGSHFQYCKFNGSNLRGADLTDADLDGSDFVQSDLTGATLKGIRANYSDFTKATLKGAKFNRELTFVSGVNFKGADLSRAVFDVGWSTWGTGHDFQDADLSDAEFKTISLNGADFKGAILSGTRLKGIGVNYCDFRGARFRVTPSNRGPNFKDTWIHNTYFGDIDEFYFENVKFKDCTFEGDMKNSFFYRAELKGMDLKDKDISRTSFEKADLTGSDLTGANASDASFDGAVLKKTKGIIGISQIDQKHIYAIHHPEIEGGMMVGISDIMGYWSNPKEALEKWGPKLGKDEEDNSEIITGLEALCQIAKAKGWEGI